jgi:beta-glucanase (GH16 family)
MAHSRIAKTLAVTGPALILATALAFTACGLQPPEKPSTQPTPPPAPPAPPAQQPTAGGAPVAPVAGYELLWSDEFEGNAVDLSRWRVASGPRRDAVNSPDAVAVRDGQLHLITSTQGGVHHTGYLDTDGTFDATYGYFEARIRFRGAPGQWCAFWLLSPTIGVPLGDPARAGAEIDVVEHRVVDDGGWQLKDYVQMTLNWDGYGPEKKSAEKVSLAPGGAPVQGEWHTYAVLWTDTAYTFYMDGVPLWTTSQALSRRSEWVQLTCEVLDASWAGSIPAGGYGPPATSTTGMDVDWVRVWRRAP